MASHFRRYVAALLCLMPVSFLVASLISAWPTDWARTSLATAFGIAALVVAGLNMGLLARPLYLR
jgi:hypothetical protein